MSVKDILDIAVGNVLHMLNMIYVKINLAIATFKKCENLEKFFIESKNFQSSRYRNKEFF